MSTLAAIPLSTGGCFAHLTWKQADLVIALDPDIDGIGEYPARRWQTTKELSLFLQEIRDADFYDGDVRYWGVDYSGTYSTLTTMLQRGVVKRDQFGRWGLTELGRQISETYL